MTEKNGNNSNFNFTAPLEANLADHNKTYVSGDDLTLTCETGEGVAITWTKDGQLLPQADNIIVAGMGVFE